MERQGFSSRGDVHENAKCSRGHDELLMSFL